MTDSTSSPHAEIAPEQRPSPHAGNDSRPTTLFRKIPLNQIQPDPHQHRSGMDPKGLDQLAQSMKNGLLNPISVRQIGEGTYQIIAGERRYRAARQLGWHEIDAQVWPADTPSLSMELLSLVENLQREELNPLDEARAYMKLTEPPYNQTQDEVAKKLGKGPAVISRAISLLDLPSEIQEILTQVKISGTHARLLSQITDKNKQINLAKMAAEEGWSVQDLQKEVEKLPKEAKKSKKKMKKGENHDPSDVDPLQEVWAILEKDPNIAAQGTWKVHYKGGLTWVFEVHATSFDVKTCLVRWFSQVARCLPQWAEELCISGPAVSTAPEETAKPTPAELSGKTRLPTSVGRSPHFGGRRPKGDKEMAEVEAAAKSGGPTAVYRWVYGQDSSMAQMMEGISWKDMGFSNSSEGCRQLLDVLRDSRGTSQKQALRPGSGQASGSTESGKEPQTTPTPDNTFTPGRTRPGGWPSAELAKELGLTLEELATLTPEEAEMMREQIRLGPIV